MIRSSDTSKPDSHSHWIHIRREGSESGFITDAQTLDCVVDLKEREGKESKIDGQTGREREIERQSERE